MAQNIIFLRGLHQDRDGTLWAGSYDLHDPAGTHTGGISRFDGQTWTTVEVPGAAPRPGIVDIHEAADGAMWFTTFGHGILRFDGNRWDQYTTDDGLVSNTMGQILESSDGALWFGGALNPGINRFDPSAPKDQSWQGYTSQDGLPDKVDVGKIWQTKDGTLWAGSNVEGIICRSDPMEGSGRGVWKTYSSDDLPLDGNVFGYPTSDGAVWLSDWGTSKVFRFDYSAPQWTGFAFEDGVFGGAYSPTDGLLWFRTEKGAVSYDGEHWLRYTAENGLIDAPIYANRMADDGSFWILGGELGHFLGASQYRDGTWQSYSAAEVGLDDVAFVIQAKDGAYWFGGSLDGKSAASRYDPSIGGLERSQAWQVFTDRDGLAGEALYSALVAENGDLWFTARRPFSRGDAMTGDGVFRYDGTQWSRYTTDNGLSHNRVYGFGETSDGTIWVGTLVGLSGFDGTKWHNYTIEDGLQAGKPRAFVSDDKSLWFVYERSQGAGVTHCDVSAGPGQVVFRTYTERDGLASNEVSRIHKAADGALWFATTGGVSRFDGQIWSNYGETQGLLEQDIRLIREGPEGTLWFRSEDGTKLSRFIAGSGAPETTLGIAPREVPSGGDLIVRWHGRDLWERTTVSDLRYQWRLDNGPWSSGISGTEHLFTSLAPGQYAFEVRAVDGDGNTDATPASHAFTVLPPWWLRNEVIGLAVLLLGLVGLQTGRVIRRDRRLVEANKNLEASNEELTLEAALDRVRGMAQGMQKSEDLSQIASTVGDELQNLNVPVADNVGIRIVNEEEEFLEIWLPGPEGQTRLLRVSFDEWFEVSPGARKAYDVWKTGEKAYVHEVSPEQQLVTNRWWHQKNLEVYPDRPRSEPQLRDQSTWRYFFNFAQGSLRLNSGSDPLSESDRIICLRFTDVFAFAYTRFLELKAAETLARDAGRRAAVDRVRAEAMAMRKAEDLEGVVVEVVKELIAAGVKFDATGIHIVDEEAGIRRHYAGFNQGPTHRDDTPLSNVSDEWMNIWKGGKPVVRKVTRSAAQDTRAPENWRRERADVILDAPFVYGTFAINVEEPAGFSEDEIALVADFADVISLGYTRYLDFQNLEENNKALAVANTQIQEQTERKSAFLASMSHELRTPMNAIKGFTNLVLRREENLSERNKENLEKVTQASDHLLAMINDLLDLSKIEAGRMDVNPELFDVKALIASCCATVSPLMAERPFVALNYDVDETVGNANTDAGRIRQMVINLLSNAIKFTDEGEVKVSVRGVGSKGEEMLEIAVSDTGKGIPSDELPTIFEEYRQVKGQSESDVQKGTGLGLSITQQFAELLGGNIGVESEVGNGTVFTARLPREYDASRS